MAPVCWLGKDVVEKLKQVDKGEVFWRRVTKDVAPDYEDFVKVPMWFGEIEERLAGWRYRGMEELKVRIL